MRSICAPCQECFLITWTKGGFTDESNRLGENICENGQADCRQIRATAEGRANRQASASRKTTSEKFLKESVHAMTKESGYKSKSPLHDRRCSVAEPFH